MVRVALAIKATITALLACNHFSLPVRLCLQFKQLSFDFIHDITSLSFGFNT
jgi:hypothetical protein